MKKIINKNKKRKYNLLRRSENKTSSLDFYHCCMDQKNSLKRRKNVNPN